MRFQQTLMVRVANVETITSMVKRFTLVSVQGDVLPRFSAGSHVMVHMPDKERTYRNAYSLLSAPSAPGEYQIAVRRQEQSRGGSAYMHDRVNTGDLLMINPPANLFSLDRLATKHILIAGGIGITPFISYLKELSGQFIPYELHYAYRASEHAAFRDELAEMLGASLHEYDSAGGKRLEPRTLLSSQPIGTHVYVCGPSSMIEVVNAAGRELGWPDSNVHFEQFSASQPGRPFKVRCSRASCEIDVPGDMSLLEALEAAGVEVPNMCRGGVCGQCETNLLEGEVEHRDSYLPDGLRGHKIMPCVSRAKCGRLVLDL